MKFSPIAFGILLAAIGCAFFTLFDAATKILVARYPVFEVVSAEFAFSVVFVLLWAKLTEGPEFRAAIRLKKKSLHLLRGLFQFASNALFAFSFMHMSLAEFYVILFLAPLLVALFASWFLGEKPTLTLGVVLLISFAGVVIAVRPEHGFDIWALVMFIGTVANAATTLVVRKLAATETAISPAYSAGVVVGILSGIVASFHFVMPTLADFGIVLLAALFYAAGQLFFVKAFRYAPAGYAASAAFLQLAYGAVIGFFLFGEVPSVWVYVGGGIVIAANLYLLWSQNRKTA